MAYLDYITDSRLQQYVRLYVRQSADSDGRIMEQHAPVILRARGTRLEVKPTFAQAAGESENKWSGKSLDSGMDLGNSSLHSDGTVKAPGDLPSARCLTLVLPSALSIRPRIQVAACSSHPLSYCHLRLSLPSCPGRGELLVMPPNLTTPT